MIRLTALVIAPALFLIGCSSEERQQSADSSPTGNIDNVLIDKNETGAFCQDGESKLYLVFDSQGTGTVRISVKQAPPTGTYTAINTPTTVEVTKPRTEVILTLMPAFKAQAEISVEGSGPQKTTRQDQWLGVTLKATNECRAR